MTLERQVLMRFINSPLGLQAEMQRMQGTTATTDIVDSTTAAATTLSTASSEGGEVISQEDADSLFDAVEWAKNANRMAEYVWSYVVSPYKVC